MNRDCDVCRAEGFDAQSRVEVVLGDRSLMDLDAAAMRHVVEREGGCIVSGSKVRSEPGGRRVD